MWIKMGKRLGSLKRSQALCTGIENRQGKCLLDSRIRGIPPAPGLGIRPEAYWKHSPESRQWSGCFAHTRPSIQAHSHVWLARHSKTTVVAQGGIAITYFSSTCWYHSQDISFLLCFYDSVLLYSPDWL